ncbi:MAG: adenylate/guanylate cyclase domain-containing protein [Alphaproteobacteria bacterium]
MGRLIVHPFFRFIVPVIFLSFFVIAVGEDLGLKQRIFYLLYDTYIKVKPRPSSDSIVFVDIDDESLAQVGQWPWPRTVVANLVRNLKTSGANVIVFDGVLAEPDRTSPENYLSTLSPQEVPEEIRQALLSKESHDDVLAKAIGEAGNFVAGFSHGSNRDLLKIKQGILIKREHKNFFLNQKSSRSVYFDGTAQFLPVLQKAAAGNGSFMASAEGDSIIRQTGLIFHDGTEIYPSLVLEALRLYEKRKSPPKIEAVVSNQNYEIEDPFRLLIGSHKIPLSAEGKMWVYYREFDPETEKLSASKFLEENFQADSRVQDKIVFIASSAEGLMDLRATPLGMRPGVFVHMNALEQILQGRYLIRPYAANVLEIGACVVAGFFIILLSFAVNPLWLAVFCMLFVIGAFLGAWQVFSEYGGLFDPVTPSVGVMITFTATSLMGFLKTEMEKRQVRQTLGLYISPDFVKELEKNPEKLRLGGENKELTIMFSDIRGFTSIAEGMKPDELVHLMNNFLTPMSDLVVKSRGTIDKYIGDAIMAFWNAPLESDHARNACRTALAMQDVLAPVNAALAENQKAAGRTPLLLKAGIGLNTGVCAVGNMGSKQRFAYSVLGDAVNLASRLEGQTKNYEVNIIIGESTWEKAQDFAALEADLIQVKGRTKATRIFVLLGDEKLAVQEQFLKLKEVHERMVAAYRAGDFKKAMELIAECAALQSFGLEGFYEIYAGRIETLLKNPPEKWDGVFVAKDK